MTKKFIYVNDTTGFREEGQAYESSEHINVTTGVADAAKPIITDASGKIDPSFIDLGSIDHGSLAGLADDDHSQYLLVAGTRAMSGSLDSGGFKIINVGDGTADTDVVNVRQLQNAINGLDWKDSTRVASTANVTISAAPNSIDGVSLVNGDRVLLKDQTDAKENGIYIFNGSGSALTRSLDADESSEVTSMMTVGVEEGTAHANQVYVVTSSDNIIIGTSDIVFGILPVNSFVGGDGIVITGNSVAADILAAGGLKFVGGQLAVEPSDFAGNGLLDDGSDNLAIDFASVFTIDGADAKAIKASSIASTTNGEGASIVGIEDAAAYYAGTNLEAILVEIKNQLGGLTSGSFNFAENNVLVDDESVYASLEKLDLKFGDLSSVVNGEGASIVGIEDVNSVFTATNVEGALNELYTLAETSTGDTCVAGEAIAKGDLLYYSASGEVSKHVATAGNVAVGIALNSAAIAADVLYASWDELVEGVLTGATVGGKVYWTGSALSQTMPSVSGLYVYQVGVAKTSADMLATVEFVKKNR